MKEYFGIDKLIFNDFLLEIFFSSLKNKYINNTSRLPKKEMEEYPDYDENTVRQLIIPIGNSQTGDYVDDVIKKVRFKEDFLLGLIEDFKIEFKKEILKSIKEEFNYDIDRQYLFISDELLKLDVIKSRIPHLYHLQLIIDEFDAAVDNLSEFLEDLKPKHREDFTKDKIKFKTSAKEICILFKKLNNLKFLSPIDDKRLGELLEKHFMYYDSRTKSYKNLNNAYGYIQKISGDSFRQNSELLKALSNNK